MRAKWTFSIAIGLVGAMYINSASAHLMAKDHASIAVRGADVFSVVSVPATSLVAFDDDHDGLISAAEMGAHADALKQKLAASWTLSSPVDGANVAGALVSVETFIQPPDDASPDHADRADQIVMLHHVRFAKPVDTLRLNADGLVDARTLDVRGRNDLASESVVLDSTRAEHEFTFRETKPVTPAAAKSTLTRPAPKQSSRDGWWMGSFLAAGVIASLVSRARGRQ